MTELVYFAHPLGGDIDGNVARARRWIAWLVAQESSITFLAPWLPYVDVFRELHPGANDHGHPLRDRFMRDNLAIASVCDGIVLCGGRVSSGMQQELDVVTDQGGWVADLTSLGAEPPSRSWQSTTRDRYGDTIAGALELGRYHYEAK
jgi:hypothetical protein